MRIIKNIYHWVARIKYKKYIVVLVLGVLLVGFIGESTVVAHLRNKATKAEWQKGRRVCRLWRWYSCGRR